MINGLGFAQEDGDASSPPADNICTVKFFDVGKKSVKNISALKLSDEMNVVTLDISKFVEVSINAQKVFIAVARTQDDECQTEIYCRTVVAFEDSAGRRGFGYANGRNKVGLGTETFKVSCEITEQF